VGNSRGISESELNFLFSIKNINRRFNSLITMSMSSNNEPNSDNYTTVRLPKELMQEIDDLIKRRVRGYKSRSEFIKEAIRRRLDEVQATSKQA
jgi:hypothetical protein